MARILIIDDDVMLARLLREHLSNEGFEVETVAMAEEGFKKATQSPPDLIMLDVNLPDATGFQMVARFRKDPATVRTPIVMMSGAARNANQLEIGKQMGASDYLVKPFNVEEVGETVKKLIEKETGTRPGPRRDPAVEYGYPEHPPEPLVHASAPAPSQMAAPDPIIRADIPMTAPTVHFESHFPPETPTIPPPAAPEPKVWHETPAFKLPDDSFVPAPEEPAPKTSKKPISDLFGLKFAWTVLAIHALCSVATLMAAPDKSVGILEGLTFVIGGWALFLGLLIGTAAGLGIALEARAAFFILGWAITPIALRSVIGLASTYTPSMEIIRSTLSPVKWPTVVFWLRPLDIFEMAAMVIIGVSLRYQPRSSTVKAITSAIIFAIVWAMTGRGYFRPF